MNFIQKSIVQKSIVALAVGIMVCFVSSAWAIDTVVNKNTASDKELTKIPGTVATVVNINTASAKELNKIPGIGKVIANRIVAYREKHGQFKQLEDIQKIKGIGSKTFAKIKALIALTDK